MTWRSIKDDPPPKDGTEFLAYDPVANRFDVCLHMPAADWIASTQFDEEWGPYETSFMPERATLWQPIEPPDA